MNTDAILSGIVTALAVAAVLVLLPKVRKVRAQEQGPDVGVTVFVEDCTMLNDNEEEQPLVEYQLNLYGIELTEYGHNLVHRQCLTARRDGRTACADCARVMVGAA